MKTDTTRSCSSERMRREGKRDVFIDRTLEPIMQEFQSLEELKILKLLRAGDGLSQTSVEIDLTVRTMCLIE